MHWVTKQADLLRAGMDCIPILWPSTPCHLLLDVDLFLNFNLFFTIKKSKVFSFNHLMDIKIALTTSCQCLPNLGHFRFRIYLERPMLYLCRDRELDIFVNKASWMHKKYIPYIMRMSHNMTLISCILEINYSLIISRIRR